MMRILSCIGHRGCVHRCRCAWNRPNGRPEATCAAQRVAGQEDGGQRTDDGGQIAAGRAALIRPPSSVLRRPMRLPCRANQRREESTMEISLHGRTAMITGASMGLGLAMAARFAESGADVALLARRPEVLAEAKTAVAKRAKGKVAVFPCDVSKAADIARAHQGIMDTFGKVDILVNNAGESKAMPFATITDEVWQADLDLKLFAAIRTCRLVLD